MVHANRLPLGRSGRQTFPPQFIMGHRNYHWFVVFTVCIGAFMAALDASIMNVTLPTLMREFHVRIHNIEWVSLIYLLTLTGLIVPFGRLADIYGRRVMYTSGFVVFLIGSLLCGLSSNLMYLLIFRTVQAVGAALLQANSVSIVTSATPAAHRGKAIGIQASAQGVGLSVGPAVGGAILSILGWKWIFFVNVPVGIIGAIAAFLILPEDKGSGKKESFDLGGTLALIPSVAAFMYVLNQGVARGFLSTPVLVCLGIFGVGLWRFVSIERKVAAPVLDFKLFKERSITVGILTGIFSFAVMYGVLLLVPFYLDSVIHAHVMFSGFSLALVPVGMTFVTPVSGALADRFGCIVPMSIGMGLTTCGCILLSQLPTSGPPWLLFGGLLLVGVGMGLFTPANNARVMTCVHKEHFGVTGSVLNMARSLGMGFGITFAGLCYQMLQSFATTLHKGDVFSFQWTFGILAVLALGTFLAARRA